MTETEIQAQGFKRLANLASCGMSRSHLVEAINKTLTELADHHAGLFDLKHELARTRLVRLPRAQFVYWPYWQHPRMVVETGTVSYLQEQYAVYTVPRAEAFERITSVEQQLWGYAEGETKVFWREWEIVELPNQQLQFTCTYCTAYIAEGQVSSEVISKVCDHKPMEVVCG